MGAGVDEYIASILVGVTRFLCSMVNTWLLRRYKRRALCIISCIGMAACMAVSGYFTLNIKNGDRSGYWVSSMIAFKLIFVKKFIFVFIERYAMFIGTGAVSVTLCMHVDGRDVDHSVDHDSGIVPD